MRAGSLRNLVTYQEPVEGQPNPDNTPVETWPDIATMNASIEAQSGKEIVNANQQQAQSVVLIKIRYPGFDLSPLGRFVFGGRVFPIAWIKDIDGRNRELWVYTTESPNLNS